ncbi:GGDEF domain-containing protein [Paucibacter sp. B2R-40]|uniref:GGDEF domain-containing protein n=1 Tax=Paucibacter sp. B2R-40 TaxID=2893554 RepID=UPI0021E3F5D2|nr:GGDEF domain-containing protein [Paucibacter sp. B2R-40]MCV2355850.1 GGDEF domain-containing protein [Paucibacter sp. B2R-40]
MFKELEPPAWLPELSLSIQRLGPRYALLLLATAAILLSVALSQLLISLLGYGDRLAAAICAAACALVLTSLLGTVLLRVLAQLEQSTLQLKRYSSTDMLTGTVNRRAFLNLIEREWALARRYETTCAMVMIDLDHFKRINENFGHRCGDMLLRQIAEASSETLRQGDVLARFGGEEFGLFLPHTDPLGALDVAERIRERVEQLDFCWNGHCIPVSVSLGVAALQADHICLDQFVNAAEDALQQAKEDGRNCVRVGDGLMPGRAAEFRT